MFRHKQGCSNWYGQYGHGCTTFSSIFLKFLFLNYSTVPEMAPCLTACKNSISDMPSITSNHVGEQASQWLGLESLLFMICWQTFSILSFSVSSVYIGKGCTIMQWRIILVSSIPMYSLQCSIGYCILLFMFQGCLSKATETNRSEKTKLHYI